MLYHGNCLDIMPTLAECSIDTIITDPPYGLEFMGKEWDHGVPGVPFWAEALRVAKPGAMLLAFGGTRTYHRLTCAIEDAGWIIKDCIFWVYGSGFPKSHDIGKAIDRAAGAEREVVGRDRGHTNIQGDTHGAFAGVYDITAPATPAAQTWDGWGTSLKPAYEPIVLAMKPYDQTYAHNAITHGVAGLNIDGARVPITDGATMARNNKPGSNGWKNSSGGPNSAAVNGEPSGRWPANILLDDAAAELLDEQSGESVSPDKVTQGRRSTATVPFGTDAVRTIPCYGDKGGASRFFMRFHYSGKASKKERTCDGTVENKHPTVKPLSVMRYLAKLTATPTGGVVLDPFMGSGSTGIAAILEGREFIGIELERESFDTAAARIAYHAQQIEHDRQLPLLEAAD